MWSLLLLVGANAGGRAADGTAAAAGTAVPLPRAHAHNDYEHARPLLDALDHGFCSVEADIHLVEGRLLVAHDRAQVDPTRTLQALYLDPLRARVKRNGGRVHSTVPECLLLIDLKTEAELTYRALRAVLLGYTNMLTRFGPNGVETNAVTVILSGNRPRAMLAAEPVRYAAHDGRLADLASHDPPALTPLISDNWSQHFAWRGGSAMPEGERQKLRHYVGQAHQAGRRIRFWGTPQRPDVWEELYVAGVDLLNADDLAALRDFLRARAAQAPD
jgi:hypothetical protein